MLHIYLLGQPRLSWHDQPLPLSVPPKTVPLLAYLLLHRERPLKRAALACALWPDVSEKEARTNLRRHLHYLQKLLPPAEPAWLRLTGDAVQWNPEATSWLDVAEFEHLSADPATVEQAIALYGGELLSGVYEDWVYYDRQRLHDLYLGDLLQLILRSRAQGRLPQAITYAQQVLAADPLREDVARQLIAARYEAGDRAGAVQEYERFAQLLRQEMDVAPMPETQALYEAVLNNAPLAGMSPGPVPAAGPPTAGPATLPFVGRAAEMARLRAHWDRAASGTGGVVLVSGEAGVGKTRLAQELARTVEAQGARTLWGSTAPDEPTPYQAISTALAAALPLLAALEVQPVWLAALAVLVPALAKRRSLPPLPPLAPNQERARLFEAATIALRKLAEPRPVLVVLEDLHWAGESSLALVEHLAGRLAEERVLVVATYRDEEAGRDHPLRALRRQLQEERLAGRLALGRLAASDVAELLRQLGEETPADLAGRLYAESEGNPLFLDILLQHWRGGEEAETPRPDRPAESVPERLRVAIRARCQRLTPPAQTLAEVAAVIGASFSIELAQEVGGWPDAPVLGALGELLDHRLVGEAAGRARFDYAFAHHLVQAVLYDDIPEDRRRRRHRRVAQVMEDLYVEELDDLAGTIGWHYERGDKALQAVPWYRRAGEHAARLYANDEAIAYLSRALELTPEEDDDGRYDLLLAREKTYDLLGKREAQAGDLAELERLAVLLGDPAQEAAVAVRQASYAHLGSDYPAAIAAGQRAITLARTANAAEWEAAGYAAWGRALYRQCDFAGAIEQLQYALGLARSAGLQPVEADCLHIIGLVAHDQGDYARGKSFYREALALFERLGNQRGQAGILNNLGLICMEQGDYVEAPAYFDQALSLYQMIGDRRCLALALINPGVIAYDQGDYARARRYYKQALSLNHEIGHRLGESIALINLALVVHSLGQYEEAERLYEQALRLYREVDNRQGESIVLSNLGLALHQQGQNERAWELSQQALSIAEEIGARNEIGHALNHLGHSLAALGRLDEAAQSYQKALQLRRDADQPNLAMEPLAGLARLALGRGDAALALEYVQEILDHLQDRTLDGTQEPFRVYLTCYRILDANGDTRAQGVLERACRLLRERAARITDPALRQSFLENVAEHCEIRRAWGGAA